MGRKKHMKIEPKRNPGVGFKDHFKKKLAKNSDVPRIYSEAANLLKRYEEENVPLNELIHTSTLNLIKRKRVYDLLCITAKNIDVLRTAITDSAYPKSSDQHVAQVMIADLITKGKLETPCKSVALILEHEEEIKKLIGTSFVSTSDEDMEDAMPIYMRLNVLLTNASDVHAKLASEGYSHQVSKPESYAKFLSMVKELGAKSYMEDYHIRDLLIFTANSSIKDSSLYKEKALILQDKASCLPVFLSDVTPMENVIDACAGEGHRASQISAAMHNTGTLLALERDKAQFERARGLLKNGGTTIATCKNDDFNLLQRQKFGQVEHIFVDAPCSADFNEDIGEQRLQRLVSFQVRLLRGALSYPAVKEVIYSTSSVREEENENVVRLALNAYGYLFEIEDLSDRLDGWRHFGRKNYEFGGKCLSTNSSQDKCRGLFMAKFVKKANPDPEPVVGKHKAGKRKRFAPLDNYIEEEKMEVEVEEDDYTPNKKRRRV